MMIRHYLDNDKCWVDKHQRVHQLQDMDSTHRENVIRMLERNADYHCGSYVAHYIKLDVVLRYPEDVINDMIDHAADDPLEFLRKTPLMRRLYELNKGI